MTRLCRHDDAPALPGLSVCDRHATPQQRAAADPRLSSERLDARLASLARRIRAGGSYRLSAKTIADLLEEARDLRGLWLRNLLAQGPLDPDVVDQLAHPARCSSCGRVFSAQEAAAGWTTCEHCDAAAV